MIVSMTNSSNSSSNPNFETQIEFPNDGIVIGVLVEQLGNGLYKLLEHPFLAESTKYGDIIRAEVLPEDKLRFIEVVESSEYNVFEFVLPRRILQ